MIYLILVLGIILFIISIAYLDIYSIAFFGLIVSAFVIGPFVIGLSGSILQKNIDTQYKKDCVEQKGLVIEQQNGRLGCINLSEIPCDKK